MKTRVIDRRRRTELLLAVVSLFLTATPALWAEAPTQATAQAEAFKSFFELAQKGKTGTVPKLLPLVLAAELAVPHEVLDQLAQQALDAGRAQALRDSPSITTQQKGAVAESAGSTTLAEKTGLDQLINLAIEQGAITKTTSGTSYTLQTTPYLLYSKFGAQDLPANWKNSAVLRQIALSATFNQISGTTDTSRNNFERAEAKYTRGQRSPRDTQFLDGIRQPVSALIDLVVIKAGNLLDDFWNSRTPEARKNAETMVEKWIEDQHATPEKPIPSKDLMAQLHTALEQVRATLTDDDRTRLQALAASIVSEENALAAASAFVTDAAKSYVNEPHSELSVAYAFQRDAVLSDFSDLKVLFSYKTSMNLSAELNGEVMLNDRRTAANGTRLERLRSYAFEADVTMGKFAKDAADFTASAKFSRPTGGLRDESSVQAKLNLYLLRGVTVPVSVSYTNRTEDSNRSRVRFNVGLSLAADALIGAARKP